MAKPSEREPEPPALRVFPMSLRPGDILADEIDEWWVSGHPSTTAGGKTANVRVKRVDSGAEMIRAYGAHERVAVKRTGAA